MSKKMNISRVLPGIELCLIMLAGLFVPLISYNDESYKICNGYRLLLMANPNDKTVYRSRIMSLRLFVIITLVVIAAALITLFITGIAKRTFAVGVIVSIAAGVVILVLGYINYSSIDGMLNGHIHIRQGFLVIFAAAAGLILYALLMAVIPDGSQKKAKPVNNNMEIPQQEYAEMPQQEYAGMPQQEYAEMPQQEYAEMPQQEYAEMPQQEYAQMPQQEYAEMPQQEYAQMLQQANAGMPSEEQWQAVQNVEFPSEESDATEYMENPIGPTVYVGQSMEGKIIGVEGTFKDAVIEIRPGESIVVGRDPAQAQIVLQDAKVSRKHFMITMDSSGEFASITCYSKNGMTVGNNQYLQEGTTLQINGRQRIVMAGGNEVLEIV